MSRIAGIKTPDQSLIARMLITLQTGNSQQVEQVSSQQVHFGWCGWGIPSATNIHGLLIGIDGHIYNSKDINGLGKSDAELIANLYLRYGFIEAVKRLNGDFTIALHDPTQDTLWLARDRFGIKPMYYNVAPHYFAFASQPRVLLSLPGCSRNLNKQFVALFAASHYRYFDNDPEASPYMDIAQLPAATILCFKNGVINKSIYWSLGDFQDIEGTDDELSERYRDLFLDAVRIRYEVAQRPAFTLSGGMDSSSVLGSAVHINNIKQHAFSTVYSDRTYDESEEIRSMLQTTVSQWHTIAVDKPDVFGLLRRMIAVHNEPVATATWLSHFLLCEEAEKQGFRGLFGGLGGDELNAGEYEYFTFYFADLRAAGDEKRLGNEIEFWIQYHDHPVFRKNKAVLEDNFSRLIDFNQPGRCLPDRRRLERYKSVLNPEYFNLESFEPIMDHPFDSYLKNRTFQDLTRETIPCCLRAEDRQSTSFGLDNFLPFFDHRLVEFMFRIPGKDKIRNGVTKHLLRQAMVGILPEETRTRVKKTGWNAPAHIWFSGKGQIELLDMVNSQSFEDHGIYKRNEVLSIIKDHENIVNQGLQAENHMMFLWQLVNLELWQIWLEEK
jgi:asparagine synthase (glutamine-hydrolysing)